MAQQGDKSLAGPNTQRNKHGVAGEVGTPTAINGLVPRTHAPLTVARLTVRLSAVLASVPSYPRPVIERLVLRLIEKLDDDDVDTDLEAYGDELDFSGAEDDFENYSTHYILGAGCPFSDPGEEDDHSGGNVEDQGERDEGF